MAVQSNANFTSELVDLNETRKAVENAENRARFERRKSDSKIGRKNSREYAEALHSEADELYRKGDYESALVLYHRAANLFPRDSSHGVAARRTAATISSCNNPSKALRKALRTTNNGERLTVSLCPETAAMFANDNLKKSPNPNSVARILKYFDTHKSFWKARPSPRSSTIQLQRNRKTASKQQIADRFLCDLETAFDSGKITSALKIAQDLLTLSAGFENPTRYQINAYQYLSLIHVALGRHDRAVCSVSRLVRLAKSTDDHIQVHRSFVTLGKVHLSFGHLHAAAKSWEYLSKDLVEPIPVAWIRHEIGRCHLETGKYKQAMEMAIKCVDAAVKGKSKKWLLYGKLLLGISLAKLGIFVDALEELQVAAKITEEEGDTPMLSYIQNLIDQMASALRSAPCDEDERSKLPKITREQTIEQQERRSSLFVSREQTVITTMFTQMITEYRDDFDSDPDERITTRSEDNTERSHCETINEYPEETASGAGTFRQSSPRRADSSSRRSSSLNKFEKNSECSRPDDINEYPEETASGGGTFRQRSSRREASTSRRSSSLNIFDKKRSLERSRRDGINVYPEETASGGETFRQRSSRREATPSRRSSSLNIFDKKRSSERSRRDGINVYPEETTSGGETFRQRSSRREATPSRRSSSLNIFDKKRSSERSRRDGINVCPEETTSGGGTFRQRSPRREATSSRRSSSLNKFDKSSERSRHGSINEYPEETASGEETFGQRSPRRAGSSSRASSLDKFEDEVTETSGTEDDQDDEGLKCASSKTSFKSANTTATYVIEGGDSKVDNGEQKGRSKMAEDVRKEEGSGSDKNLDSSIQGDDYLQVIERLGKMEDMDLLMLLREKLLEEDWCGDLGNSGDTDREKRRTRSCRDTENRVVENH